MKWLHGESEAEDDYWKADDGGKKNKGEACSGQMPEALRIERIG